MARLLDYLCKFFCFVLAPHTSSLYGEGGQKRGRLLQYEVNYIFLDQQTGHYIFVARLFL